VIGTDRFQVAPLRSAGALFGSFTGTDSPLSARAIPAPPPYRNPVSRPCLTTRRTSDACPMPPIAALGVKCWEHSDRILRGCLPSHQGQPPAAGRPAGALGASRGSDHACRKGSVGREKHR
jgi:hypothetical protein